MKIDDAESAINGREEDGERVGGCIAVDTERMESFDWAPKAEMKLSSPEIRSQLPVSNFTHLAVLVSNHLLGTFPTQTANKFPVATPDILLSTSLSGTGSDTFLFMSSEGEIA